MRDFLIVVFYLLLPSVAIGADIPDAARRVLSEMGLDESGQAAVAEKWPAKELEDETARWSETQRRVVSDEARAIIVAQMLAAEQSLAANSTWAEGEIRQAAVRALSAYLDEHLEDPNVTPMRVLIGREVGEFAEVRKEANRLATIAFPIQTSGRVATPGGEVVARLDKANSVTLTSGEYLFEMETTNGPCKVMVDASPGKSDAPACR